MEILKKNILSLYKDKGRLWLESLPQLSQTAIKKYNLSQMKPVENLSYNYVLSGFQGSNPVILKLGVDLEGIEREALALKAFEKVGGVKLLVHEAGLLLLERLMPGESLATLFPREEEAAIHIACEVMKKLHQAPFAAHPFKHIQEELSIFDRSKAIPAPYLSNARKVRDQLLRTSVLEVVLHGDLHHRNILKSGSKWVAIDPKGLRGDPFYDVAAFIRNPIPELQATPEMGEIIHKRINIFSHKLEVDPQRIHDWCFVQAALAWIWAFEDGGDVSVFQELTEIFHKTIIF